MSNSRGLVFALAVALFAPTAARAESNWQPGANGIPADAVVGGYNAGRAPFMVCRAYYAQGAHLGTTWRGANWCNIGWGGREVRVYNFEILTPMWTPAHNGYIPPGAVVGGHEGDGTAFYICRDHFRGNDDHPGKIRVGFSGCFIGWGGNEETRHDYEVLVSKWAASWIDASGGARPPEAIIGGRETGGTPLYLCRAYDFHGVHPGKFRSDFQSCKFTYGGAEYDWSNAASHFKWELLGPTWESAINGNVPWGAVGEGRDDDGSAEYVCRAYMSDGSLLPGRLQPTRRGCAVGYYGKELVLPSYDVLVER